MGTVCLIVATIIGAYCVQGAEPIGDCRDTGDVVICYVDDPLSMDVWASTYDPELGGINCNADCSHTATRPVTSDMYFWAASCPPGWTHRGATVILEMPFRDSWCIDHGGAIIPTWREVWLPGKGFVMRWVIVVDFMHRSSGSIWWTYGLIPAGEWSMSWGFPPKVNS